MDGKEMISLEDRIYGLSLLWREAEYNFAYWDELPKLDWNARYHEYLPKVMAAQDPLHYYAELKRFVAVLRDGHTYVEIPEEYKPSYTYNFSTTYGEGKHLLWGRPKSSDLPFFSRIAAVNGIPVEEYVSRYIYPYIWHENLEAKFGYSMLGYVISCCERDSVRLETENGSLILKEGSQEEEVYPPQMMHPCLKEAETLCKGFEFQVSILCRDIAYIRVDTFASEEVAEKVMQAVEKCGSCKSFIVDVRENSGGSSRYEKVLAEVFFEEAVPDPPCKSPVSIAEFRAYGQYRNLDQLNLEDPWEKRIYDVCRHGLYYEEEEETPEKKSTFTFHQPVVVLTGARTASAAEDFLARMKYHNRSVFVGQRSMGTNGQPFMGRLPGGGSFGICTQKCYLFDGTNYNNVGIAPDVCVENTIEDRRNGFDRVLDTALQMVKNFSGKTVENSAAGLYNKGE